MVMRHYGFHNDRGNNSKNGNIIPDDDNKLLHLTFVPKQQYKSSQNIGVNVQSSAKNSINIFSAPVPEVQFLVLLTFIIKACFTQINIVLLHRKTKYTHPPIHEGL